jgi:hypothetical protein
VAAIYRLESAQIAFAALGDKLVILSSRCLALGVGDQKRYRLGPFLAVD